MTIPNASKKVLALAVLACTALFLSWGLSTRWATAAEVTVYKSPTCGCCKKWVSHLEANGFKVKAHNVAQSKLNQIKSQHGVMPHLASCHTALVEGYVVEGHVPADVIKRLLKERPKVAGISVPGMPMGSPGMEGPRKDAYNVLTFDREGKIQIYEQK